MHACEVKHFWWTWTCLIQIITATFLCWAIMYSYPSFNNGLARPQLKLWFVSNCIPPIMLMYLLTHVPILKNCFNYHIVVKETLSGFASHACLPHSFCTKPQELISQYCTWSAIHREFFSSRMLLLFYSWLMVQKKPIIKFDEMKKHPQKQFKWGIISSTQVELAYGPEA